MSNFGQQENTSQAQNKNPQNENYLAAKAEILGLCSHQIFEAAAETLAHFFLEQAEKLNINIGHIFENRPSNPDQSLADQLKLWILEQLTLPPARNLGDLAFPCFILAKQAKQNPAALSQRLAEAWNNNLLELKAQGPFLNMFFTGNFWQNFGAKIIHNLDTLDQAFSTLYSPAGKLYPRSRLMVEYSQPNTHKSFHIGHVRNVCLGDSLARITKHVGFEVVAANYIGDVGTHVAKFLWYYHDVLKCPEIPTEVLSSSLGRGVWLGQIYQQAETELVTAAEQAKKPEASELEKEKSAAYQKRLADVLTCLVKGEEPFYSLWKKTKEWSMQDFFASYERLGAHFDEWFFESEVEDDAQKIVEEYFRKGVFQESQGAVGLDLSEQNLGFCLLRKKDGNTLYATKDLSLARLKFQKYAIDRSIYVVDSAQAHHFRQVFATLKAMGFSQAESCFHLSYGRVVLPEGKMSSRTGNVVLFKNLWDDLQNTLQKMYQEKGVFENEPALQEQVIQQLCVGAIRYGMIRMDPEKQITYDASEWTSLEGATGTYVQYTGTRLKSVLRKLENAFGVLKLQDLADHTQNWQAISRVEIDLLLHLCSVPRVLGKSADEYKPSLLARYAFELCQVFNQFYAEHNIMHEENLSIRKRRQFFVAKTLAVLSRALKLIGVEIPEKM